VDLTLSRAGDDNAPVLAHCSDPAMLDLE
jgi:hypothetical protein